MEQALSKDETEFREAEFKVWFQERGHSTAITADVAFAAGWQARGEHHIARAQFTTPEGRPIFGQGSPHHVGQHLVNLAAQPDKAEVFERAIAAFVKELEKHKGKPANRWSDYVAWANIEHLAKSLAALPPTPDDGGLVDVVPGWRLYAADFSINWRKGNVTLIRDEAGFQWWHALPVAEKEETSLFETGFGTTFREALIDANAKAAQAKAGA